MNLEELWRIYPGAKITKRSSGNNEIDSQNPPILVWINGNLEEAEKQSDSFEDDIKHVHNIKSWKRIGPREFNIEFRNFLVHYTDEYESF